METMNQIMKELEAAMRGEPAMSFNDPQMPTLLAELRTVARCTKDQELLGRFSLSLMTARLRSGLCTERAIGNAIGSRGRT